MAKSEDRAKSQDRARALLERALLLIMLLTAAAVWFGLGSLMFLGIIENVSR